MFDLLPDTRTLVVICAYSSYDAPPATASACKQLQALERVEPTVQRLVALFSAHRAKTEEIQTVILLNQDDASLLSSLKEIRNALREKSDVNMLLFWSGHGSVPKGSFRLATRNTFDPINYEDGLGLGEVMRQSGIARVATWTLLLDACYAGEGLADVVKAAQELLKSESGQLRGYGALCSSSPYEKARDSVFLGTVVSVLEIGPSEAAKAFADQQGGGGSFNPFNRLLSVGELFEAVANEYRADTAKFRGAKPWPILGGEVNPRLFPNPQYQINHPSRLVEESYRSIARRSDLESHFFPKALGIENLESGWHFSGRVEATRSILTWMSKAPLKPEDRLYVIAADAGTGKSALLGRLIALSDRNYRTRAKEQGWIETEDIKAGTVPTPDQIDAALSLRNLTSQTVAENLASLLALGSCEGVEEFVKKAANTYRRSDRAAPCLFLDALDEATEPLPIIFRIIRPLVEFGWKLLVATRRSVSIKGARDLLVNLRPSTEVELDKDEQSWNDIYAYAIGRLQPVTQETGLAESAARLIADRADSKFLFARMATSSLLRRSKFISLEQLPSLVAKDSTDALTSEIEALDRAFGLQFSIGGSGATAMLTALACAEGEGVPIRDSIWAAIAESVGLLNGPLLRFEDRHIDWLLREAGQFIQESGDGEQAVYRLFHKSLVDHFQRSLTPNGPVLEALYERIAMSLVVQVRQSRDWASANPYLVRHMAAHLALRPEQVGLNELLLNFDWLQSRLNLNGINALLSDYGLCHNAYPATARLLRTLRRIAHILRDHPNQLIPQLLGRIRPDVPSTAPLPNSDTIPNVGFSLPLKEQAGTSRPRALPWLGLEIQQGDEGASLKTFSLDPLLARAKSSLRTPRMVPEMGGLSEAGSIILDLRGHTDGVTCVALSADGRTVASGSYDRTVRLWDAQTGQIHAVLKGHTYGVTCVALSADGRTVASGSSDRTVRLWDAQTGQTHATLSGHNGRVTCVAISSDGRYVASAGTDRSVRLWDARSGQSLHTMRSLGDSAGSIALSADGRTVVSAGKGTMRIWNVQTGQPLRFWKPRSWVTVVALSADGGILASAHQNKIVRLWDTRTGRTLRIMKGRHEYEVLDVLLSADGRIVISADQLTVCLRDAQSGKPLRTMSGFGVIDGPMALGADGLTVACASGNSVHLLDPQSAYFSMTKGGFGDSGTCMALSADGRTFASGRYDQTVRLWDAQTCETHATLIGHNERVTCVALSSDGRTVASGSYDRTVRLWDAQTGQAHATLSGHNGRVTCVALSSDGRYIASAGTDQSVQVWSVHTHRLLRKLQVLEYPSPIVTLSADGRILAAATHEGSQVHAEDRSVRLWDGRTGGRLILKADESSITSVALSADGNTLASACGDMTIRIWDLRNEESLTVLKGHVGMVTSVALSAEGHILVSASRDGTVRFWNTASGQCIETITLDGDIEALTWADQGTPPVLVVSTGGRYVRFLRIAPCDASLVGSTTTT